MFLSHLIEPDSRHPQDHSTAGAPPGSGEVAACTSLANVLRVLADSTPMEEDRGGVRERMGRLARDTEQGDSRALVEAPDRVLDQRQVERRWIEESVRDLADGVVGVLLRLGRSAGDDRSTGRIVTERLEGLREVARGESIEEIRRGVLSTVQVLSETLQKRQERQDKELLVVSGQLQKLKGELNKVRREATLDGLTRLANRASLDEHMGSVLAVHRISGRPACLLMVDVDRFKDLNDRLGHPAGDAALRGLSDALSRAFPRKSDFVARYGGEEFAVVLSEDGEDVGKRLAERLLGLVRGMRIPWEGEEIGISISIGVAMPGEGDEVEDWVGRADRRLYQAKQEGRDRAV
jgi:diguanylate cyclase (GGDEF)-like protein